MKAAIIFLIALISPEVLYLTPADTIVRRGGVSIFDQSDAHINFETGGSNLCDDARGTYDLTVAGTTPTHETVSPVLEGTGSLDGDDAGGCTGDYSGLPWNDSDADWSIAFRFQFETLPGHNGYLFETGGGSDKVRVFVNSSDDVNLRAGSTTTTIFPSISAGTEYTVCLTHEDNATDANDAWSVYTDTDSTADFTFTGAHTADTAFNILTNTGVSAGVISDVVADAYYMWDGLVLTGAQCGTVNGGAP